MLQRAALGIRARLLGERNRQTLLSMRGVIETLIKQNRANEAGLLVDDLREKFRQGAVMPDEVVVGLGGGKDSAVLDILALAYFMSGDTSKAVETQEKTVSQFPPGESPNRTELEANLAKYRAALAEETSPSDDTEAGTEPPP